MWQVLILFEDKVLHFKRADQIEADWFLLRELRHYRVAISRSEVIRDASIMYYGVGPLGPRVVGMAVKIQEKNFGEISREP